MWVKFTKDHDHKWPSRAVTAYKAGMIVSVKKEVADLAVRKRRAVPWERPERGAEGYLPTHPPYESGLAHKSSDPVTGGKAATPTHNPPLPVDGAES